MKKLTLFLFCLLAVVTGAIFLFDYIGVTQPVLYYAQYENQKPMQSFTFREDLEDLEIPAYFNCMDYGKISPARDQGEQGVCWAFAANTALESRLLPNESWDFSEDHMIYHNGFYKDAAEGGDFFMAAAYLTAWKGPVTEQQDPYNDGQTNDDAEAVKHVQEVLFLENGDFETIRKMIYCYGAVESSIYIAIDDEQYIDEVYYSNSDYSYCYDGDREANHEITIIGWDDSYPAGLFKKGASHDGAFICLNSWGSGFGNNGIFYVSYDDVCIGKSAVVYTAVEDADNYDHIYQYDEHGWVGRMGFDSSSAFFANVYTARTDEQIRAVSFYATDENTSYSVYVCPTFSGTQDLLFRRELKAQGMFRYAGYYTVQLDQPVSVSGGEKYAVIVEIDTPGSKHPVAIEMDAGDGRTGAVELEGRESYISANGRAWDQTQTDSACNICLKAFTDAR